MSRRSHLIAGITTLAAAVLVFGSVHAQSSNVAATAVIAYSNLLAPGLVAEVAATFESEPNDAQYALAILDRMLADLIIDEAVYLEFSDTVFLNAPLSQGFLELWLLDVITGSTPLVDVLVANGVVSIDENGNPDPPLTSFTASDGTLDFEGVLASEAPGLVVPAMDADGIIAVPESVDTAILTVLEDPDVVEELQRRYDDAISPTNPDDVA